ncbi:hypothetical protein POK33_38250 [Burkholderia cenocepacia]|uniref:hypothetical protein n=1 Tax=Burkholderia cenocepacia TaxID=95486 RepID=UPI0023B92604|nr:hypothetical protein [Burkholderia cenocepacia]MDF0506598.1 hypothetical protein [Burkholderia cenocepacia]
MSIFDAISKTLTTVSSAAVGLDPRILSSDWTGLNPALLAKFYALKRDAAGTGWEQSFDVRELSAKDKFSVYDGWEVWAPITDGTSEMTLNWHSPFEGAGAESKAPTISSMLQSGSLAPTIQALGEKAGAGDKASQAVNALSSAQGRVGITKLNSTQVFQGMPPVKLSITAHFRALIDPVSEVQIPISQLQQWAVPQYLADDGVIANAVKNGADQSILETVFPSLAPQIIGMKYGDRTYEPLVIESISEPITNPRSIDGVSISCSVTMTLATLTAIDRRDIQRMHL